jgi:hypothetical protein
MIRTTRHLNLSQIWCSGHFRQSALRSVLAICLCSLTSLAADAADIEVTNSNDAGAGSLRAAIENAVAGDRIVFNIPGGGTIILESDLPQITDSVTFTNPNVAAVTIDRNTFDPLSPVGPLTVTGGVINLGELQFEPLPAGDDINLGVATTLIGDGDQITADIRTSGVISPGATTASGDVGTLFITGDLDATNATIRVDVLSGPLTSNDLIDVTGAANVTDATLAPILAGSAYSDGDTFTVLSTTTGITGTLANAADTFELPSNPFLEASINATLNDIQLLISDNGLAFSSLVQGCNQLASANELDRLRAHGTGAQMGVIADLRSGSTDRVNGAVQGLSGTIYPSLVDGEFNQIQNNLLAVRDRVLLQRDDLLESGRWSPWVRGYGMTLSTDRDDCLTEGYRQEVAGVELGTGTILSSGIGVHGFAQFGSVDTGMRGMAQNAESDSYRFGGSIQYVGEIAYLLGMGGFGFQNHEIQRSTDAFNAGTFATSDVDGTDQFVSLEVGTASVSEDTVWLSFVSLQGILVDLDAATESGPSDFDLLVNGIDDESLRSMVGFSLSKTNGTALGPATTQVRLGWLHEFLNQQRTTQTAVEGGAPVFFDVSSTEIGRDWLSAGAQLDWGFILGGQFTLAYQGNLNSHSAFQSGLIGTRWVW